MPKKAVPITGKRDLEEDGSNLAIVLKNIIEDKRKKRKFSNLARELLPFVQDVDVQKFADKSLLFNLQESYTKQQYLPASLLSDGTISMTALIIALYFERKGLIIIEEPERNVHPSLISKMVNMFKEASENKQIIITTHNAQMVKYCGIDNLLLVCRNEAGFSTVCRPGDMDEVKAFLKNQIGVEDLFTENLLA